MKKKVVVSKKKIGFNPGHPGRGHVVCRFDSRTYPGHIPDEPRVQTVSGSIEAFLLIALVLGE